MFKELKKSRLTPGLILVSIVVYTVYTLLLVLGLTTGILKALPLWLKFYTFILPGIILLLLPFQWYFKLGDFSLIYFFSILTSVILPHVILGLKKDPGGMWILGAGLYSGVLALNLVPYVIEKFLGSLTSKEYLGISEEFTNAFALNLEVSMAGITVSAILLVHSASLTGITGGTGTLITVVAILLGLSSAITTAKKVSKTTKAITRAFNEIKQGNYSFSMKCLSPDECGKLLLSFNQMSEELSRNMEKIIDSREKLENAVENLSNLFFKDMNDVNNGIAYLNNTIASLSEVAETLETLSEIGTKVYNQNEKNYKNISESIEAVTKILGYINTLKLITASMAESSKFLELIRKKTSTIVRSVREIANQIQILAINAEIEASDAGEHGKRFMVIAEEIRRLAEKSSDTTDSIEESLDTIIAKIEEINHSVKRMEEAITENEENLKMVADKISSSTESLESIREGVEEIFSVIEEIKATGQTITSSVSESNRVLSDLAEKVVNLQETLTDINLVVKELQE